MGDSTAALLRKLAADAYDLCAVTGDPFDLAYVAGLVEGTEVARDLGPGLLAVAVAAAVRSVDESRRDRPEQTELFGDLDRVLAIGDGTRRRKGSCNAEDYARHIGLVFDNAARVAAAAAREQDEYDRLLPYLNDGLTVEEAVRAIEAGQ